MNNNNEKTFADLFLNSKDDDVKDDNLTFDTFSNDVGSSDDSVKTEEALKKEKEAISFSGFNSMVMEDDLKVDNTKVGEGWITKKLYRLKKKGMDLFMMSRVILILTWSITEEN